MTKNKKLLSKGMSNDKQDFKSEYQMLLWCNGTLSNWRYVSGNSSHGPQLFKT